MNKEDERLFKIIRTKKFKDAALKAQQLKEKVEKINRFRLDAAVNEADSFFSSLKKTSPTFYSLLRMQQNEIYEIAFEKRTGHKIIID